MILLYICWLQQVQATGGILKKVGWITYLCYQCCNCAVLAELHGENIWKLDNVYWVMGDYIVWMNHLGGTRLQQSINWIEQGGGLILVRSEAPNQAAAKSLVLVSCFGNLSWLLHLAASGGEVSLSGTGSLVGNFAGGWPRRFDNNDGTQNL